MLMMQISLLHGRLPVKKYRYRKWFCCPRVCTTDADSNLVSVVEHTQIEQYENGIRFTEDKGETWHDIDGDTTVP